VLSPGDAGQGTSGDAGQGTGGNAGRGTGGDAGQGTSGDAGQGTSGDAGQGTGWLRLPQLAVPVLCASWTLAAGVSAPGLLLAAAMPLLVWMQDLVGNRDMAARAPLPSASSGDGAQHFPSRSAVLGGASM